ncbi:hypothetical protein DVP80_14585 [Yersinia enterocolitica]|nr:hypothetical protein [Yersinia enterocolitica]
MREVFIHTLTLVEVARDIKGIYLDESHHVIDFYKNMVFFPLKIPASEDGIQPMFMSIDTLKQIFK